jgi:hypothetical protein
LQAVAAVVTTAAVAVLVDLRLHLLLPLQVAHQ